MNLKEQVIKKSALSPTVLIAGGAGFIGSHLAEKLLSQDARVVVIDNFKTGKDLYLNKLQSHQKFALFDADINQGIPDKIQSVDYVIHLAGVESYLYSRDQLNLDSLLTNAVGTKNLLELAHKSDAKFLLVSSIDVYEGLISPLSLDQYFGETPEEEKRYSLSEAKRFAEALVWEFYKKHQTDVRIARLPEVYGPRMNLSSSGAIGYLLKELLDHKNLTIYGDGTEKEYYVYISDAINGLVKALFNNHTEGQIFTLAPEEPHAVLETAYLVKRLADSEMQVEFKSKTKKDSRRTPRIPDRGDLRTLRWEPKVELKEGVKKTMEWFGYQPNEHAFKPAKLIEEDKKRKQIKKGNLVTSLTGEGSFGIDEPESQDKEKMSIAPIGAEFNEEKKALKETVSKTDGAKGGLFSKLFKKKDKKPDKQKQPKPKKLLDKTGATQKAPPKPKPAPQPKPKVVPSKKQKKVKAEAKGKNNQILYSAVGIITATLIFAVLPLVQTVLYTKSAVKSTRSVAENLSQFKTEEAKEEANNSFVKFHKAQKSINRSKWLFTVLGMSNKFDALSNSLSSAKYFARATYDMTKAAAPFAGLWETIKPNTESTFDTESFSEAKLNLENAKNNILRAQADFKNVDKSMLPAKLQDEILMYEQILNIAVENIDSVTLLAQETPALLGAEGGLARYLVLFQNSNEIRPTGGFIGSYAIIEIENGKIKTITIDDIYNPDGQIDVRNIQVDPPEVLAELLDEDRYYIRNANWNPDFTVSANDIKNLYFKVTGKEVTGVIGLDLEFAENMLRVTGPIYLTAFGEEISTDNLYERTQHHSEFNYENGSDQKKTFLTILGRKLLESIFALSNEDMPNLLTEVEKALSERHLLLSIDNSSIGAELNNKKWNGGLVGTDSNETDYLYVVNSNVGGTKANYFVKNDMNYVVSSETRDGLLRASLELKYNHTGEDNSWPGGPYKDYVRVLTQKGAKLTGASFSTNDQEPIDVFEDIVVGTEDGYQTFEYLVEVEPQQSGTLTINYDLPQSLSITAENIKYDLYWQKQPGTDADPVKFTFKAPFGLEVLGDKEVDTKLSTDKAFSISLK